jgi:hypothetical protein
MSELSVEKYINSVDTNTDEQNQKYLDHFHKIFQKESKLSKIPSFESYYEISSDIVDSYLKQNKFMVLLIAATQFGKTGIIFQVMREMVTNNEVIAPFIFTLTGMANNDWREQTKNRVLPCMADNVWHYRDLIKKKNYLKQIILSKANVLIIIDEVHIGLSMENTIFKIFKYIFNDQIKNDIEPTSKEIFELLHKNNVRLLLVSATPDCINMGLKEYWIDNSITIVAKPEIVPTYIWQKSFLDSERISQTRSLLEVKDNIPFYEEIILKIQEYDRPLYHMIRLETQRISKKTGEISNEYATSIELLNNCAIENNVKLKIILWDSDTKPFYSIKNPQNIFNNWDKTKTLNTMTPEDLLIISPKIHIIFILKDMFRVAQTMPINNIGILVDRFVSKINDSTITQSLIGRACGHNKKRYMNQIYIYTNVESVKKYVSIWANDWDMTKVSGYNGYGIKSNNKNTKLIVNSSILGEKFDKNIEVIVDNNNENNANLLKVKLAYEKTDNLVYKIIQEFIKNNFEPLSVSELSTLINKDISIGNHTGWGKHNQYKILEKNKNSKYILTDEIIQYLKLK